MIIDSFLLFFEKFNSREEMFASLLFYKNPNDIITQIKPKEVLKMNKFNKLSKLQRFFVSFIIIAGVLYAVGNNSNVINTNKGGWIINSSDGAVSEEFIEYPSSPDMAPTEPSYGGVDEGGGLGLADAKIISTHKLTIETKEFNETIESIENLAKDSDGYVSSRNIDTLTKPNNQRARVGYLTLKIPFEKADTLVKTLKEGLTVTKENSDSVDVTNQYSDLEATIKSLQSQEDKLNQLMERALNIEDIITIDSKLTEVIREKEMLTRNLLNLKDRVRYTTITIDIQEVKEFTTLEDAQDSLAKRLNNAFFGSLKGFVSFGENLLIFLVWSLPFIALGAGLVWVSVKVLKKKKE